MLGKQAPLGRAGCRIATCGGHGNELQCGRECNMDIVICTSEIEVEIKRQERMMKVK